MGNNPFQPATKEQAKARIGFQGSEGSGKTYAALVMATALGKKIAFIDTEKRSAKLYADEFTFDVMTLEDHHPDKILEAIKAAEENGYDVVIIDSMSDAWEGTNGVQELRYQSKAKNDFVAWDEAKKPNKNLINYMKRSSIHVIVTMRTKVEYEMVPGVNWQGKAISKPQRVGMKPIQVDGLPYHLDSIIDLNRDSSDTKTVWIANVVKGGGSIPAGTEIVNFDYEHAEKIRDWLVSGEKPVHWVDQGDTREKLFAYTQKLGMTEDDVHKALEVDVDINEYHGNKAAAMTLLQRYAASMKPTTPPEESVDE